MKIKFHIIGFSGLLLYFTIVMIFIVAYFSYLFNLTYNTRFIYCILFLFVLLIIYFNRDKYFNVALIFCFVYSFFLGLPAVYMLLNGDLYNKFYYILMMVIFVNVFIYMIFPYFGEIKNDKLKELRLSKKFYFIFYLVSLCQLYKIIIYFNFILISGEGHLAIYSLSDELHSTVPFWIRAITGFSSILALMTFFYPSNRVAKIIAIIILASDLLIGIRGKFLFFVLTIFVLYSYQNKYITIQAFKKFTKLSSIIFLFLFFSWISYYREGYSINFLSYLLIVLDSLASTLMGVGELFDMSLGTFSFIVEFDKFSILSQLSSLLGFNFDSVIQISQTYSNIVLGDRVDGINLSSSIVLESILVGKDFFFLVLIVYLLSFIFIIKNFLESSYIFLNIIAICMLPGLFFSVRAEFVQVFVLVIKSLPIILISKYLVLKENK